MSKVSIKVERQTIEQGRTLSREAMVEALRQVEIAMYQEVWTRWQATGEPPTVLSIELEVTAQ